MHDQNDDAAIPLDPVPLTLAVWLGVIVCVTGVLRVSEDAAAQSAQAQAAHVARNQALDPAAATDDMRATQFRLVAFAN